VQVSQIQKIINTSYNTTEKDLITLTEIGILKRKVDAKEKTFFCPEIIQTAYYD